MSSYRPSRPPRQPRRLLGVFLLGLLGALSFGAIHCGKSEGDARAAALAQPPGRAVAGGELVFGFDGAAITEFVLDPEKSLYAPHHRVMRSIFDSLVVALPGHRFGPWLAKSWEVSPDGLTYTFHLRDDVTFHDGTKFDAEAVKFNLDRIKDPKNALYAISDIGPYASTTIVDPYTATVTFTAPFAPFLSNLAKPTLGMVSPAAVRNYGADLPSHPVGTGPFRFKSLEAGTEIALERNPDYRWPPAGAGHEGPARLDRLIFKNVPEEETRVAVLMNGQAGGIDLIPPQNLATLRASTDYQVIGGEFLNHNYSLFLNSARPPWSDERVRTAFRLSLDIDAAVRTVYLGTTERAWSPLSPSLLGYDKSLEGCWKPDVAAAARTLDDLGWKKGPDGIRVKDGASLRVVYVDTQGNREKRLDLITVFRKQLRDNGFDLRVDSQPQGAYLAKVAGGDFDLVAASQFASDPDVLRRLYSPKDRALWSVAKMMDPALIDLVERGARELDPEKRKVLYARAQHLIVEDSYAIPTYVLAYTVAVRRDVHDVGVDAYGFPVFYDAWVAQ
jgi:peptide/nickel transport system substrate-binding protein